MGTAIKHPVPDRIKPSFVHPDTVTLIQDDWNKLDSFHVRCQRRILYIKGALLCFSFWLRVLD